MLLARLSLLFTRLACLPALIRRPTPLMLLSMKLKRMLLLRQQPRRLQLQAKFYRENITFPTATRRWDFLCFCCGFTQFYFYYVHSHGQIWNPPLRSANPVAFCLPLTSAGWGHPALHPTKKGERRAASLWPPCPLPATVNLPCYPPTLTPQTKASLVKGGAEPARRRDSCPSAGVTACRHSPSESLRPPAASTCSPSGATRHLPRHGGVCL